MAATFSSTGSVVSVSTSDLVVLVTSAEACNLAFKAAEEVFDSLVRSILERPLARGLLGVSKSVDIVKGYFVRDV
jgi:hypothetical protein